MAKPDQSLAIIFNPASGSGKKTKNFHKFIDFLKDFLYFDLFPTAYAGHATELAAQACASGYRAVVAAGGDGTVYEVLNGMDRETPLGVAPFGTANVLAKTYVIPEDPIEMAKYLINARVHFIDTGLANGHRFTCMLGAGFDALVASRTPLALKRVIGEGAYFVTAVVNALFSSLPQLKITGEGFSGLAPFIVVSNSPLYGGGFLLSDSSSLDDGLLEASLFRRIISYRFFKRLVRMLLFHPTKHDSEFGQYQCKKFVITGPPGCFYQLDGELTGSLPVEVSIEKRALPLLIS